MSQMNAVEITNGGDATMVAGTEIVLTTDQFHAGLGSVPVQ